MLQALGVHVNSIKMHSSYFMRKKQQGWDFIKPFGPLQPPHAHTLGPSPVELALGY